MIRPVQDLDYVSLVSLFKKFFPVHNQFQLPKEKVISYLKSQASQNELIVYDDKGIKGAMFLVNFGSSADNSHKLWKFRHFAFENEDIGSKLLKEAEKIIKKKSKTVKIELTIAETEPGKEFYLSNGYKQEAALTNHYRWGETCYVLAKSLK